MQKGILFALQLGNSPDLHPIKRCFDALKDEISTFLLKSASDAEKLKA